MKESVIRVAKICPHCGTRLFDKISLTTGFVEIKCPHCKHVVCINLALRMSHRCSDRSFLPVSGF